LTGVAIVILNWNNWRDTIDCLESVFRNTYPDFRVVVVDNGSLDDSVARILEWAQGSYVGPSMQGGLRHLVEPPVPKPIACLVLDRETEGVGWGSVPLLIVKTGVNLGFAGGNNVALRRLMRHDESGLFWLLNNDTVVTPDALSELVGRLEQSPRAGMCGSLLPYFDRPGLIWAQGGGSFNRWLARSGCIGNGLPLGRGLARDEVERRMKYVTGASLLVTRAFVAEVGLLCEDYFLYFEEPDWAFRGNHRFSLVYAPESVVYHKVGMSTVKGYEPGTKIDRPESYIFRNSLKFTRKFSPYALPLVFFRAAANRFRAWVGSFLRRKRSESCE
jgi:GT2 family glycosyltransferase